MARIKLTKPWTRTPLARIAWYAATWESTRLEALHYDSPPGWKGYVKLLPGRSQLGEVCQTLREAQRDAERMAVEMVDEIVRTVGPYLAQFGMEVDDE